MKKRFSKDLSVINGFLAFCHVAGASSYDVHYEPKTGTSEFEVRAKIENLDNALYESLSYALALKRTREVEQNYWELGVGSDSSPELTLLGMMLDYSAASYEDGILTITAKRFYN